MSPLMRFRRRFARDARGVSAVEFALILPILIILFLGSVELSQAISVDRKVTSASSAVGDLVAQSTELSNGELDNILDAATAILAPFKVDRLRIVVSSVRITENGPQVDWSTARNTACYAAGTPMEVPNGVAEDSETVIVAEAEYLYQPIFGQIISDTIRLSDRFYLRPRTVAEVTASPVCDS